MTTNFTATLTTSASADVVEGLLDELPDSAMLGSSEDAQVDVIFPVAAESSALALLAACGSVARIAGVLGDADMALRVSAA